MRKIGHDATNPPGAGAAGVGADDALHARAPAAASLANHPAADIAGRPCPLVGGACLAPGCGMWVGPAEDGMCLERHTRVAAIADARERQAAARARALARQIAEAEDTWRAPPRDPPPEDLRRPTPDTLATAIGEALRAWRKVHGEPA